MNDNPKDTNIKISHFFVALLLVVGCGSWIYHRNSNDKYESTYNSLKMPKLSMSSLDGKPLRTKDLTGKVYLIRFFASWCKYCTHEHKSWFELAKVVDIYGVAWRDNPSDIGIWLSTHGNPFNSVGLDVSGAEGIKLGIVGIPTTFLVDACGSIVLKHVGPIDVETIKEEIKQSQSSSSKCR